MKITIAFVTVVSLLLAACDNGGGLSGVGKTKSDKEKKNEDDGEGEGEGEGDIDIAGDGKVVVKAETLDGECVKADLPIRLQSASKAISSATNPMIAGSAKTVAARQALATSLLRCASSN